MKNRLPKSPRSWYLARQLEEPPDKWARIEDFAGRTLERPVGLINGAFDILHASHVRLVTEARTRALTLVAALDSDKKVTETKGHGRPVLTWTERAAALSYLGVDWVVEIEDDDGFVELCRLMSPDFRVLGFEYVHQPSRIPWVRKVFVRDGGVHTSDILKRIDGRRAN